MGRVDELLRGDKGYEDQPAIGLLPAIVYHIRELVRYIRSNRRGKWLVFFAGLVWWLIVLLTLVRGDSRWVYLAVFLFPAFAYYVYELVRYIRKRRKRGQ